MMSQIGDVVYSHYKTVDGNICNSAVVSGCSFSNLTYNQWLSGSVLYYPLADMDVDAIDTSYTKLYQNFTILKYPPEAFYYAARSGYDFPAETTIFDVYQSFNVSGLYNPTIQQNIWLQYDSSGWSNIFTNFNALQYFRYVALNFGYGGLFTATSPNDQINGGVYTNDILGRHFKTPVYMGGDKAINLVLAVDKPVSTYPPSNSISFFTGEGDATLTRQLGLWQGLEYATIKCNEYTDISNVKQSTCNPWAEQVPVSGTDGLQFQPNLSESDTLSVFNADLQRTVKYTYQT